jgi:hypothetical protein
LFTPLTIMSIRDLREKKMHIKSLTVALISLLITIFNSTDLFAQEGKIISRDKLIQDVRVFCKIIEDSHPDPYIGGGGKIAFHRRLQETLQSIPTEGMEKEDFYKLMLPFVASIKDAHTAISLPENDGGSSLELPLELRIIEDKVYVAGVFFDEHRQFVGDELTGVEGFPFAELIERQRKIKGYENDYGNLINLVRNLKSQAGLQALLPEWKSKDKIRISLKRYKSSPQEHWFAISASLPEHCLSRPSKIELPKIDERDPSYKFLNSKKSIALLRVDNMTNYREAFEHYYNLGLKMTESRSREVYRRFLKSEPPENTEKVIARIPAVTDTFMALVKEMKDAGTKTLLIDLRFNEGGDSLMSDILIYYLYGWDLYDRIRDGYEITKYSDLYFLAFKNKNIEDINEGRAVPLLKNDYNFDDYFKAKKQSIKENKEDKYDIFANKTTTFANEIKNGEYEAYYCPENVIVLTSPETFSSGFWLAADLSKASAKLVGTASSQAGNSFGDVISWNLPNSGIFCSVSTKQFVLFPDDSKKGKILNPDCELTYEKLAAYDFDPNAEVLLALEYVSEK